LKLTIEERERENVQFGEIEEIEILHANRRDRGNRDIACRSRKVRLKIRFLA